jgi:hypothetical protein
MDVAVEQKKAKAPGPQDAASRPLQVAISEFPRNLKFDLDLVRVPS